MHSHNHTEHQQVQPSRQSANITTIKDQRDPTRWRDTLRLIDKQIEEVQSQLAGTRHRLIIKEMLWAKMSDLLAQRNKILDEVHGHEAIAQEDVKREYTGRAIVLKQRSAQKQPDPRLDPTPTTNQAPFSTTMAMAGALPELPNPSTCTSCKDSWIADVPTAFLILSLGVYAYRNIGLVRFAVNSTANAVGSTVNLVSAVSSVAYDVGKKEAISLANSLHSLYNQRWGSRQPTKQENIEIHQGLRKYK